MPYRGSRRKAGGAPGKLPIRGESAREGAYDLRASGGLCGECEARLISR